MTWPVAAIAIANIFQVVALTWIAAWQQRAAQQRRKMNGAMEQLATAVASAER